MIHSTAIIYNLLVAIFVAGISAHGGRSTRVYSSTGLHTRSLSLCIAADKIPNILMAHSSAISMETALVLVR
jgi:hypothetical protein